MKKMKMPHQLNKMKIQSKRTLKLQRSIIRRQRPLLCKQISLIPIQPMPSGTPATISATAQINQLMLTKKKPQPYLLPNQRSKSSKLLKPTKSKKLRHLKNKMTKSQSKQNKRRNK